MAAAETDVAPPGGGGGDGVHPSPFFAVGVAIGLTIGVVFGLSIGKVMLGTPAGALLGTLISMQMARAGNDQH